MLMYYLPVRAACLRATCLRATHRQAHRQARRQAHRQVGIMIKIEGEISLNQRVMSNVKTRPQRPRDSQKTVDFLHIYG